MGIVEIISASVALIGVVTPVVFTTIKLKDARKKEKDAEQREFYLYSAYNLVREAERMFGDAHGEEKKQYAMTRIQNEALSSGVKWDPKLASTSIEQAVALRNDYKNPTASLQEVITMEKEKAEAETESVKEELEQTVKTSVVDGANNYIKIKKALKENKPEPIIVDEEVKEDNVISVVEN